MRELRSLIGIMALIAMTSPIEEGHKIGPGKKTSPGPGRSYRRSPAKGQKEERQPQAPASEKVSAVTTPDRMPALVYVPAPCPKCGARTQTEAETMCRPTRGMDDEYSCPAGDDEYEDGKLRQPTAESIKALNEWYDREGARDGN